MASRACAKSNLKSKTENAVAVREGLSKACALALENERVPPQPFRRALQRFCRLCADRQHALCSGPCALALNDWMSEGLLSVGAMQDRFVESRLVGHRSAWVKKRGEPAKRVPSHPSQGGVKFAELPARRKR